MYATVTTVAKMIATSRDIGSIVCIANSSINSGKGAWRPASTSVVPATDAAIISEDTRAHASDSSTTGNWDAVSMTRSTKVSTDIKIAGRGRSGRS